MAHVSGDRQLEAESHTLFQETASRYYSISDFKLNKHSGDVTFTMKRRNILLD